jgi:hypothetical protein
VETQELIAAKTTDCHEKAQKRQERPALSRTKEFENPFCGEVNFLKASA